MAAPQLLWWGRVAFATLGVFASDHRIKDAAAFHAALRDAITGAERGTGLVTLGIAQTRAATGYGSNDRGEAVLADERSG